MADLTQDFLLRDFKLLVYEFTQLNNENNTSIPVYGIFIYNIANSLIEICEDLQNRYNVIIYRSSFSRVDGWFQTNQLYSRGNQISFQNLDKLTDLLQKLSNAIDYMNSSSYQNYLLNNLPGYVSRLQYAINFVARYTNDVNQNYGNVVCDHTTTYAKYGFNDLKIFCGS